MKEIRFDFVELESDASFEVLANAFGGTLQSNTLFFDNLMVKGELVKRAPEKGLWIRKWKLTVLQKITLHRDSAPADDEQKFSLIYFLNPSLFKVKKQLRKVPLTSKCSNLFASNALAMDFSVVPMQPFYAVDITFTLPWFQVQLNDAAPKFKAAWAQHLQKDAKTLLMVPCMAEDYKTLHELDTLLQNGQDDLLSIRARIYTLLSNFINKAMDQKVAATQKKHATHYDQMIQAEAILVENLQKAPTVEAIAQRIHMSTSSLLRQFKAFYGKSPQEYYIEKKMERARMMIAEEGFTIRQAASMLGYKQGSPFIEMFKKQFGYCPGLLKA